MLVALQDVLEPLGTATRLLLEALSVLTVLYGLLAADIVATTISPSESNLIQLGAIAVIRTGLNVFLGRDIEAEQRWEEEASRRATARGVPASNPPPHP
jgi:uncharacterized membrane protein